jgi:hypothetical protein
MKKFLLVITLLIFNMSCVEKTTEGNFNKQLDSAKIQSNNDENLENHEPEWIKIEIPNGDLTSEQIVEYVATLKGWIYQPDKTNIDVDDLATKLSDRIVGSINSQKSYNLSKILKLDTKFDNEKIKVFSLGHDSGGTRGFINYPIIVWEGDNKKQYAFNLSNDIKCKFEEIHKLANNLFLLIGYESGSGAGYQSIAYVIEIKNDKLNNKYCGFVRRPYLNFRNGKYSFNNKTKILDYKEGSTDNLDNIFYYPDRYGEYVTDSITAKKMKLFIEDDYYEKLEFRLKFNGKSFVGCN